MNHVHITGITPQQMHLAYDELHMTRCPKSNLPMGNVPTRVKVMPPDSAACMLALPDPCAAKFAPMQYQDFASGAFADRIEKLRS